MLTLFVFLILSDIYFIESKGIEQTVKNSQVQTFDKLTALEVTSHRISRDIPVEDDCSLNRNVSLDVTVSTTGNYKAVCSCTGDVKWAVGNCSNLADLSSREFEVSKANGEVVLYCISGTFQSGDICIQRFMLAPAPTGLPIGIQGFIIFVCVSTIALTSLFIAKKYKTHIALGCRDNFSPTSDQDGKEFDAYVSIANSDSDKTFVQRNFLNLLQKEHNYTFLVDDENLLPRLEYSNLVQEKIHKCRRMIVVFTAAYMTNDWCMYCFSEGLRKLVDLNIPLLFIFNDVAVVRELNSHQAIVGHVTKVLVPLVQTKDEQLAILRKIRLFLPAAHAKNGSGSVGMRSPMLSDAEEMDSKSIRSENYGGTSTKYTFEKSPAAHDVVMDDVTIHDVNDDEMQFDDEMDPTDPKSIKVHHYQPRKDFYSLTVSDM